MQARWCNCNNLFGYVFVNEKIALCFFDSEMDELRVSGIMKIK